MLDTENENNIKAEAIPYTKWIYNITELINLIDEYKEKGENYSFDFKDKKFYSLLDDEDSCYKKVTGMTKDEYLIEQERLEEKRLRVEEYRRQEAIKNIPNWVEKGKKFIYPQKHKKWADYIEIRAEDRYHGVDIDCALIVMDLLDKGVSFQEVFDTIKDQNHSGNSYSIVMSMITHFSKKGPEFYRFVDKTITPATENMLAKIENENKQFAEELNS